MGFTGGDLHGRPRARSVDCRPNRFAVRSCHNLSPNGAPRTTERRKASNSAALCGVCTCCRQRPGSATGPSSNSPALLPWTRCQRLDHRHASACWTRFARNGFRSTYRSTAHKWSSSWIGNDLKRPWYSGPVPAVRCAACQRCVCVTVSQCMNSDKSPSPRGQSTKCQ